MSRPSRSAPSAGAPICPLPLAMPAGTSVTVEMASAGWARARRPRRRVAVGRPPRVHRDGLVPDDRRARARRHRRGSPDVDPRPRRRQHLRLLDRAKVPPPGKHLREGETVAVVNVLARTRPVGSPATTASGCSALLSPPQHPSWAGRSHRSGSRPARRPTPRESRSVDSPRSAAHLSPRSRDVDARAEGAFEIAMPTAARSSKDCDSGTAEETSSGGTSSPFVGCLDAVSARVPVVLAVWRPVCGALRRTRIFGSRFS